MSENKINEKFKLSDDALDDVSGGKMTLNNAVCDRSESVNANTAQYDDSMDRNVKLMNTASRSGNRNMGRNPRPGQRVVEA